MQEHSPLDLPFRPHRNEETRRRLRDEFEALHEEHHALSDGEGMLRSETRRMLFAVMTAIITTGAVSMGSALWAGYEWVGHIERWIELHETKYESAIPRILALEKAFGSSLVDSAKTGVKLDEIQASISDLKARLREVQVDLSQHSRVTGVSPGHTGRAE